MRTHEYITNTTWTGNRGTGTSDYKAYDRAHVISIQGKPDIHGSSDASFRGDKTKHTPEDLFVTTLSTCHMLWYLHLCAVNGIIVTEYHDEAKGIMEEQNDGGGSFKSVTLHPMVTITDPEKIEKAMQLHSEANKLCFIARSVNFPVSHLPECVAKPEQVAGHPLER